jgi:hypothetical protein
LRKCASLILRPHPEENLEPYLQSMDHNPNLTVIRQGSVIPWILASTHIFHTDCTTAIEAAFLGFQPISLLPSDSPELLVTKLPLMISRCFTDVEDAVQSLHCPEAVAGSDVDLSKIEEYFALRVSSTDTIANWLEENIGTHIADSTERSGVRRLLLRRMFSELRAIVRSYEKTSLSEEKLKGFEESTTQDLITRYRDLGYFKNVAVKYPCKHLAYFTSSI